MTDQKMIHWVINDQIKIEMACMESYPCQHMVTIDGKKHCMFGQDIYKMLKEKNLTIPRHFESYKDYKEEEVEEPGVNSE